MRSTVFGIFLIICGIFFTAGCASDSDIRARMLNYKNSEFGFEITFPENWQSYRVFESKEYISAETRLSVFHICLPTRSRDWQSQKVAAPYAVMFSIIVFTDESLKAYTEGRPGIVTADSVLGRTEKNIFIIRYPSGLPIDLYQFMKEIDRVIGKFRVIKQA